MEQKPSIGRIVHYTTVHNVIKHQDPPTTAAIFPAMITRIDDIAGDYVCLKVFTDNGIFDQGAVHFTDAKAGTEEARGHWTWPERV